MDDSDEECMRCCLEIEKKLDSKQDSPAVADVPILPTAERELEAGDANPEKEKGFQTQGFFPYAENFTPCPTPRVAPEPRICELPATDEEASSGSSKPAKCRRLNSKQADPSADADVNPAQASHGADSLPDEDTPEDLGEHVWWEDKNWRQKYLYVVNRIRRKDWYSSFQQMQRKKDKRSYEYPAKWSDMTERNKQKFIEYWAEQVGPEVPHKIRDWAKEFLLNPKGAGSPKQEKRTKSKQLLLTYQGPFGELSWQENLSETKDPSEAAESCKKLVYVSKLWDAVLNRELPAVVKRTRATNWAACMEVCPDTLAKGLLRIHLHVCLQRGTDVLYIADHESLNMFRVAPHVTAAGGSVRSQGRRSCQLSAMYYCSAPKIGQIYWASNLLPYKDYAVNAEWTWNLLQQGKLSPQDARSEFVRGKKI